MEELTVKRNKHCKKPSSREELELLDKKVRLTIFKIDLSNLLICLLVFLQELIDRILQLEAHTYQLKNIIKKCDSNGKSARKSGKPFDFTQYVFIMKASCVT